MRNGIADRRSGWPASDFAGPERNLVLGVDQFDVDFRHFAELEDRVGFPVERGDAIVETDLFLQHPACPLYDPAFELVDHAVRIDYQAGVSRTPHVMQGDCLVDRKLYDHSGVGGAVLVAREANAAATACAAGSARGPFRHRRNFLDYCTG